MTDFTMSKDADGVATITWDVAGKTMNVMSIDGVQQLSDHIDDALADDAVKGIVITSGKETFAGGMDLNLLAKMKADAGDDPAKGLFEGTMRMHGVLRKIERAGMDPKTNKGGKPIASALPGTAAGIGLELPLATHRIFCTSNPKTKVGLPETLVGIFPGGGGTVRLLFKMGLVNASSQILEGRMNAPEKAKSLGIVDEVSDDPLAAARAWVLSAKDADILKPWDAKGF
jgi:3-hydroxyacyl-CoA dehydrogenase/enoyl-CoA hydratase/3-hydroxybutyryl-CoA epimerase